jgi:RND family efflux transporter MFP subunit
MKKILMVLVVIIVLGGVVALLFYNKSKVQEKLKSVEVLKEFPVTVDKVKSDTLTKEYSFVGTITADKEVAIISETQGRITYLGISQGQSVGRGRIILTVDDEIKAATLQNAEAAYERAKKDYERNKQLFEEKSISQAAYENSDYAMKMAEAQYIIAKRQLADTKLVSPVSGVVASKNVELGTVIAPGTMIANIVDISRLKIKVNVPERDVFKLKINDAVNVETDIYPDVILNGKIRNISPKADEAHSYLVEISLVNNRQYPLKAGMFARVMFENLQKGSTLVIPRQALVGSIRNPQVYLVQNQTAYLKKIVIGSIIDNKVQVNDGLKEGDVIVVNGQINLKDNTKVRVIK